MGEITRQTIDDRTSASDADRFTHAQTLSRNVQDHFQSAQHRATSEQPAYLDLSLNGLYGNDIYTGISVTNQRAATVSETEERKLDAQIQKTQAPEGAVTAAQFTDNSKQATWTQATESYRMSIRDSATMIALTDDMIAQMKKNGGYQKFELYDPKQRDNGSAQDTGTVIDYRPQELQKGKSFALGMDYEEGRDVRTPTEKLQDFLGAAAENATNPENYKQYIQSEIDKLIGVAEGMNQAKEETKAGVAAGWKALTDGSVAAFLSKPNAINEPLFHTVGSALDAMSKDPQALNKATVNAVEALGNAVIQGNDYYNKLPDREKGHVIGHAAFALVNPEGSTKSGEAALKIADTVATHVDAAVMKTVDQSLEAIKKAPDLAADIKQGLYEYIKGQGLTGPELEAAGIPRGFFDDIQRGAAKDDTFYAMSKADDAAEGMPRRSDGSIEREPVPEKLPPSERFTTELSRIVDGLSNSEKAFLHQHGIEVKAVRRITDVPEATDKLAGCYRQADKTIYVPEEVFQNGQWVKNNDAAFIVRHEYGHALNAKAHPFGDPLSDKREFIDAFNQDFRVMPSHIKETLQLSENFKTINAARDEVFADLWAHSSGLTSNNPYSQLMKQKFPNVLRFFMERR